MSDFLKAEITVRSVIDEIGEDGFPTGEPEITLITEEGVIASRGDFTALEYTERGEGGEVQCRLILKPDGSIHLSRSGAVECRLDFAEGKTVKTLYRVPPYSFDMTLTTQKIRKAVRERDGEIALFYTMNVGGRDTKVNMKIGYRLK